MNNLQLAKSIIESSGDLFTVKFDNDVLIIDAGSEIVEITLEDDGLFWVNLYGRQCTRFCFNDVNFLAEIGSFDNLTDAIKKSVLTLIEKRIDKRLKETVDMEIEREVNLAMKLMEGDYAI